MSVVHGWPVLATNQVSDEVSAVAVDSHDHVLALTRGGRQWPVNGPLDTTAIAGPTVYVYDGPSGGFVYGGFRRAQGAEGRALMRAPNDPMKR